MTSPTWEVASLREQRYAIIETHDLFDPANDTLWLGVSADAYRRQVCAPLELKRFTEPSEVAALVGFLISREASGITGRDWLLSTIWNQA